MIAVYRSPGPHFGPNGKTYDCKGVLEDDLQKALDAGWNESFLSALGLSETGAAPEDAAIQHPDSESAENAPPSRSELEAKADELGIKYDGRTTDRKLYDRITEALAAS